MKKKNQRAELVSEMFNAFLKDCESTFSEKGIDSEFAISWCPSTGKIRTVRTITQFYGICNRHLFLTIGQFCKRLKSHGVTVSHSHDSLTRATIRLFFIQPNISVKIWTYPMESVKLSWSVLIEVEVLEQPSLTLLERNSDEISIQSLSSLISSQVEQRICN